jgi:hypothetical protein
LISLFRKSSEIYGSITASLRNIFRYSCSMPVQARYLARRRLSIQQQRTQARVRVIAFFAIATFLIGGITFVRAKITESGGTAVVATETISKISQVVPTPAPFRVGIQAGHWLNSEMPADEFPITRIEGTGASVKGVNEWEVNLAIATSLQQQLEAEGLVIDLLPATVPKGYTADAFISIHADGNEDTTVSGYKVSSSSWDTSGNAALLAQAVTDSYGAATKMRLDPSVSDTMTQYYAFNFRRFQHAISKGTPGILVEVGFISNDADREFVNGSPEKVAAAIAPGVLSYLRGEVVPIESPGLGEDLFDTEQQL